METREILILKNSNYSDNPEKEYFFEFLCIYNDYTSYRTKIVGSIHYSSPEYIKDNVNLLKSMEIGDFIKLKQSLSKNTYSVLNISDVIKLRDALNSIGIRKNHSHVIIALSKANKLIRDKKIKDILI